MHQNPELIENSLGSLLGRSAKLMGGLLEEHFHQGGYEFSLVHWIIFIHLWRSDGSPQCELAKECGQDKTAITRAVDWLEKRNYVLRIPDQQDRRHKLIYLTQKGKELPDILIPYAQKTIEKATAGISEEEMTQCKNVLRKVFNNLKAYK